MLFIFASSIFHGQLFPHSLTSSSIRDFATFIPLSLPLLSSLFCRSPSRSPSRSLAHSSIYLSRLWILLSNTYIARTAIQRRASVCARERMLHAGEWKSTGSHSGDISRIRARLCTIRDLLLSHCDRTRDRIRPKNFSI